jgi:hypothetical protein
MNRLRSVNPLRGLVVLALTLGVCVLGAGSATAAGSPQPVGAAAAQASRESRGVPGASSPCPATASKQSSRTASCAAATRATSQAATAGRTALPSGGAACASNATKRSSSASACSRSAVAASRSLFFIPSVSLAASPVALAPGGTTTLTASANEDVGPTPYYIEIFDQTTGANVGWCGFGSTCSTSVTQTTSTIRDYIAYIALLGFSNPPPDIQATSGTVTVTWLSVSLSASPSALLPGGTTTLTATASLNVGPTPYYIEIFDQTTGANVGAVCGSGTTCSALVSQPFPTTHAYVAFVSGYGTGFPPPNVRATSNTVFVTWF